jgi:hypothetical protein
MNELICYCFEYNRKDIEDDLRQNGRSLIIEKIQTEKKLGPRANDVWRMSAGLWTRLRGRLA